jgi:predicted nucleotidyltransferase
MIKTTIAIRCRSKVNYILEKLQNIQVKKTQLSLEFTDCEVLQKHYTDLLKAELPKEEEKQASKKVTKTSRSSFVV